MVMLGEERRLQYTGLRRLLLSHLRRDSSADCLDTLPLPTIPATWKQAAQTRATAIAAFIVSGCLGRIAPDLTPHDLFKGLRGLQPGQDVLDRDSGGAVHFEIDFRASGKILNHLRMSAHSCRPAYGTAQPIAGRPSMALRRSIATVALPANPGQPDVETVPSPLDSTMWPYGLEAVRS